MVSNLYPTSLVCRVRIRFYAERVYKWSWHIYFNCDFLAYRNTHYVCVFNFRATSFKCDRLAVAKDTLSNNQFREMLLRKGCCDMLTCTMLKCDYACMIGWVKAMNTHTWARVHKCFCFKHLQPKAEQWGRFCASSSAYYRWLVRLDNRSLFSRENRVPMDSSSQRQLLPNTPNLQIPLKFYINFFKPQSLA